MMTNVRLGVRLFLVMARPAVLLLMTLYLLLGLAQAGHANDYPLTLVTLVVVMAFLVASLVINDLSDVAVDRVNLPHDVSRPLVSGVAQGDFALVGIVAAVVAVVTAGFLGLWIAVVVAAGLMIAVGYSFPPLRLSGRGIMAPLVVPACLVGVPYLVGLLAGGGRFTMADAALLAGLYVGLIGRLLLKDFRDLRGDELFGKRTFLVRRGRVVTCRTSAGFWVVATGLLLVAVPDRTPSLIASYVIAMLAVLGLLSRLAVSTSPRRDTLLIGAIAIVGRGVGLTLLAHLSMRPMGWAAWQQAAVVLALTAFMAGLTGEFLRNGPRVRGHVPQLPAALTPIAKGRALRG
jgi:4-hydroxybenzoate polyprenyltransferase